MLYCGVFLMTYCWTIVLRLASNSGDGPPQEPDLFPIMVLRAIFLPAMGLGTVLVYSRPRYGMLRNAPAYKDKGRWWTLKQVLWDDDLAGSGGQTHGTTVNGGASFSMVFASNRLRSLLRLSSSNSFRSTVFASGLASRDSNDAMLSPIEEEQDGCTMDKPSCHSVKQQIDHEDETGSQSGSQGGGNTGIREPAAVFARGVLEIPDLSEQDELDLELAEYEVDIKG